MLNSVVTVVERQTHVSKESHVSIDWLSFTLYPIRLIEGSDPVGRYRERVSQWAEHLDIAHMHWPMVPDDIGRRPYTQSVRLFDNGLTVWFSEGVMHQTVEISGKGCDELGDDHLEEIMRINLDKITRFDVAVDIRTDTLPRDFIAAGYSRRYRTRHDITSPSGDTIYIGSPESDVMCRVYRYNSPHPRHEFLRIEFQLRRARAVQMAELWLSDGPVACAQHAAHMFSFQHPDWSYQALKRSTLPAQVKSTNKTQKWLMTQVKQAMLRLLESEEVSPDFWHAFFEGLPNCSYSEKPQDSQPRLFD